MRKISEKQLCNKVEKQIYRKIKNGNAEIQLSAKQHK